MRSAAAWGLVALGAVFGARPAAAQGHGPVFGLSTPTLGRGGWSLDLGTMYRRTDAGNGIMLRSMLSYGITEDFQASLSLPVPAYVPNGLVSARVGTRMAAAPDVELVLAWRPQRSGLDVGSRFETTLFGGLVYPTDAVRGGIETSPGIYAAGATGYASRSVYLWVGAAYRRYLRQVGAGADRLGDVVMYSLVAGYRPPPFRHDYPGADWRLFLEAVGEYTARDRNGGVLRPDTGGHRLFVGPTLLGLYGNFGIAGGPVFEVWRRTNGTQPGEPLRVIVNTTFWF